MLKENKIFEKQGRAARLQEARKLAGFTSAVAASERFGWNPNSYKAHEAGRNDFVSGYIKEYAKAFKVSLNWLQHGIGLPTDDDAATVNVLDVPIISWVSAGQLTEQDGITDFSEFPTVATLDLPEGDWIALKVDGNSMNKISPPGSIIFVNRRDRRLAPNALYVVADETGSAVYKRYRPGEQPPFQPVSYDDVAAPKFEGAVSVIGRVRRSIIDF
ncbi:S24 family peptidase [Xaviernesmea rhizosphaerae]|uniref:S24 family peptidase n=1 Tax=Xaviernesmea rhizosphaerae TaxID=1672749 RepID=UPI00094F67A1|nr:S24 family peptidase [Xaviernesmea rhizosphaerae]